MKKFMILLSMALMATGCGGGDSNGDTSGDTSGVSSDEQNSGSIAPGSNSYTFDGITITAPRYQLDKHIAGIIEGNIISDCIKISSDQVIGSIQTQITLAAQNFSLSASFYTTNNCSGTASEIDVDSGTYSIIQNTQTTANVPVAEVDFLYSDGSTETSYYTQNEAGTQFFELTDLNNTFHVRYSVQN